MAKLPAGLTYDSPNVNLVGYNPAPGPQQPGKYPIPVGAAYQHFGEQAGYLYDPYRDEYQPDPNKQRTYYEDSGLSPKKPKQPGALEGLGSIAAGGAALVAGQQFIKDPSNFVTNISSGIGKLGQGAQGMLGIGSPTSGATSAGAASAGGAGAAPSGAGGLLGVGNAGALPAASGAAPGVPSLVGSAAPLTSGIGPVASGAEYGASLGGSFGPVASGAEYGSSLAGAETAAAAPSASGFSLGGIGSAGNFILPAAGAFGAFDVLSHDYGPGRSALEGAASGAAMGSYFGPWGAVVGGVGGGLIGLGKSVLFKDEDKWKTEGNKLQKLAESGAYIPQNLIDSMPTKGRKLEDLVVKNLPADFVGRDPNGNWVNNKFAKSRNVADLQGTDIVNYSAFAEHDPQWFTKPLDQRIAIADQALASGAVREHHGTIDVDFGKFTPGQAPQVQGGGTSTIQPMPPKDTMPGPTTAAPAAIPPKGTRLSPGIYADGRGGQLRRA